MLDSFATLAGGELAEHAGTPAFLQVRALAIEAFYSDFVAPGVDASGRVGRDRLQHAPRDAAGEGLVVPRDLMRRGLDGAVQGAEVPASPAPERR